MALFIVYFHYTDEIKLCLACLRVSHAGTCVQILRQTANFGGIFVMNEGHALFLLMIGGVMATLALNMVVQGFIG